MENRLEKAKKRNKEAKFVSYNRLYYKNKPVGKEYKSEYHDTSTKTEATKKAKSTNAKWNRFKQKENSDYTTKLERVKKISRSNGNVKKTTTRRTTKPKSQGFLKW
jgi:hypothetical protein